MSVYYTWVEGHVILYFILGFILGFIGGCGVVGITWGWYKVITEEKREGKP